MGFCSRLPSWLPGWAKLWQWVLRAVFHICNASSIKEIFIIIFNFFFKSHSFVGLGEEKRSELDIFFFCLLDGHHVWEMEAKTDKEMCKPVSLP